jgi:hypothetical protein
MTRREQIEKSIDIKEQDDYELVLNKFDINTLKPFDKVLVRDSDKGVWCCSFFSHYTDTYCSFYSFRCVGTSYRQCVPYEGNEYLLGTTDDCDDFYKTW